VFDDEIKSAINQMNRDVINCKRDNRDVVWDQTSTTIKSRKSKLATLPDYHKIAIVFPTPDREELNRRLAGRVGKDIPKYVVDSMINNFEVPTRDEGFDEIWTIEI
jgi:predicted kinase